MDDTNELRKHRRPRTLKDGRIVFNSGSSSIDCIIRDRSESGAKLRVPAPTALPEYFELLSLSERMVHPAQIMWRRGDFVGIAFVGRPKPEPRRKKPSKQIVQTLD